MRVLLGNIDEKEKDLSILRAKGPTFFLVFINMVSIERYLMHTGELRQSITETNSITQFSKIIMSNSKSLSTFLTLGRHLRTQGQAAEEEFELRRQVQRENIRVRGRSSFLLQVREKQ